MKINLESQLEKMDLDLTPAQKMTLGLGIANLFTSTSNHIARYGDVPEYKAEIDKMEDNPESMIIIAGKSVDYGITKFRQEYDAIADFNFLGERKEEVREKVARGIEVTFKTIFLTQVFGEYIEYKTKGMTREQEKAMSKDDVKKMVEGYVDEAIQKLGGLEELRAPARQLVGLVVNIADSELY